MMGTFDVVQHTGRGRVAARAPYALPLLAAAIAMALPSVARAQTPITPPSNAAPLASPSVSAPLAAPSMQAPAAAPSTLATLAPPAQAISPARDTSDQKAPETAFVLSALSTAAGVGLIFVGGNANSGELALLGLATVAVGPSFGHIYAGETGHALAHSAVRVGSMGAMLAGVLWDFADCFSLYGASCDRSAGPVILFTSGVVVGASSAIYSIFDASRAAQRHNARAQRFALAAAPLAGPDHSSGFGLHLSGKF